MKHWHGFTIIELIVVVAIIGMIASVVLVSFSEPRANSRDARREADMKEIRNGLNLYINDFGTYPLCSLEAINGTADCLSVALRDAGAMSAVPKDPKNIGDCDASAQSFVYCYESNDTGTSYALHYHLETNMTSSQGWHIINP